MFKTIADIKKSTIFAFSLIAFCCLSTATFSQSVVTQTGVTRVVVDAGHGGLDPGAVGKFIKEKDLNLEVALLLGAFIKDSCPGVEVIYTRDKDVFIALAERAAIANKHNADLFISIHTNWVSNKNITGTETYVMGLHVSNSNMAVAMRENAVITYEADYSSKYEGYDPRSPESFIIFSLLQNAHLEQSLQMAARVQEEFGTAPITYNRGVKQAGFLVLWRTAMPSILVEMGFISNEQEEKKLNKKETKVDIAKAIFRAFKNYKIHYDREHKSAPPQTPEKKTEKIENPDNEIQKALHYRVQIKVSSKKIPLDNPEFAGYAAVRCIPFNTFYKYTTGNFTTFEDASRYCNEVVRPKTHDAFVVCVENGKIVPIKK
jgi:N-acetylmuramoyl-L-alanine amidase